MQDQTINNKIDAKLASLTKSLICMRFPASDNKEKYLLVTYDSFFLKKYGFSFLEQFVHHLYGIVFIVGVGLHKRGDLELVYWSEKESGVDVDTNFGERHMRGLRYYPCENKKFEYPEKLKLAIKQNFNLDVESLLRILYAPLDDFSILQKLCALELPLNKDNEEQYYQVLSKLFVNYPEEFEAEVDELVATVENEAVIINVQRNLSSIFSTDFLQKQKNNLENLGQVIAALSSELALNEIKNATRGRIKLLKKNLEDSLVLFDQQKSIIQSIIKNMSSPEIATPEIMESSDVILFLFNLIINTPFKNENLVVAYRSLLYKFGEFLYNNSYSLKDTLDHEQYCDTIKTALLCFILTGDYKKADKLTEACFLALLGQKGIIGQFDFEKFVVAEPRKAYDLLNGLLADSFFTNSLATARKMMNPYALLSEILLYNTFSTALSLLGNDKTNSFCFAHVKFLISLTPSYSIEPNLLGPLVNACNQKDFEANVALAQVFCAQKNNSVDTYLQTVVELSKDADILSTSSRQSKITFIILAIASGKETVQQAGKTLLLLLIKEGDFNSVSDVKNKLDKSFYPVIVQIYFEASNFVSDIQFLEEGLDFVQSVGSLAQFFRLCNLILERKIIHSNPENFMTNIARCASYSSDHELIDEAIIILKRFKDFSDYNEYALVALINLLLSIQCRNEASNLVENQQTFTVKGLDEYILECINKHPDDASYLAMVIFDTHSILKLLDPKLLKEIFNMFYQNPHTKLALEKYYKYIAIIFSGRDELKSLVLSCPELRKSLEQWILITLVERNFKTINKDVLGEVIYELLKNEPNQNVIEWLQENSNLVFYLLHIGGDWLKKFNEVQSWCELIDKVIETKRNSMKAKDLYLPQSAPSKKWFWKSSNELEEKDKFIIEKNNVFNLLMDGMEDADEKTSKRLKDLCNELNCVFDSDALKEFIQKLTEKDMFFKQYYSFNC